MHKHSSDEKDAILHHLNKNNHFFIENFIIIENLIIKTFQMINLNHLIKNNKFNLSDATKSTKTILVVKKNKINNTSSGSSNENEISIPNINN